uniref:KIB1-4 beta-propeller domain-containing protein n=1 Tax=Oryza glumipatula TaxID=40148 RepID=A0A0E0A512_9ORYZ
MALQCSVAARSPPLPWLTLLHGTFLSISDGEIHRMPLPNDASCHGSIDNWLFLRDSNGGCSLMNLFSKATLHLPKLASIWHDKMERAYRGSGILLCNEYTLLSYKFAVPLPLDSSPVPLVAVLINDPLHVSAACICYQPIATDSFISHDFSLENKTYDIAFCGGKLYALSASGKLYILEISEGHEGKPEVSCINSMVDLAEEPVTESHFQPCRESHPRMLWRYLVESGGRFLQVIRLFGYPFPLSHDDVLEDPRTLSFVVYEADLSNGSRMWRRVESLGGQALFGGTHGSKSVPAVECGAQEDCIYFISDYNRPYSANPLGDSGIYNMRNGMITPLVRLVSGNRHSGVYYQWRHPRWVVRHLFPLLFAVPTKRPRHDRALTGDGEGALPERTKARGRRPSTLSSPGYLLWRKPPRTAHCLDTSGCCLLVDLRRRVPRPRRIPSELTRSSSSSPSPEIYLAPAYFGGCYSAPLPLLRRALPPTSPISSSSRRPAASRRSRVSPAVSKSCMMAATQSSSWADLQMDILGLVLRRLPSLADRVRLRAVCRPWCSNAQLLTLPPPFPWLNLLDGTFLSISDGEIHRMPLPDDASCYGSIDNWLFLTDSDDGCSLMNPFSKATLQLPKLACIWHHERGNAYNACTRLFYKLAVPLPLDLSSDSLVAVLINDPLRHSVVCIVHRSIATDSFRFHDRPFKNNFYDIAFCGGKLYALSCGKLFTVEMSEVHIEKPKVPHVECIVEDFPIESHSQPCPENHICVTWPYLVESGGRLLNVIRLVGVPFPPEDDDDIFKDSLTFSFEVYEADLNTGSRMWRRVESLGDQALFVGRHCSKSLSAAEYVGAQEDCIYFMCDDYFRSDEDPLCDAGIYNMRSGVITPLLQENTAPRLHPTGEGHPTWFFPADGAIFHRLVGRGPTWPKSPCTEVHHRGRRTLDELTPSSSSPAVVYLAPLRRSLHGYRRQFSPPQLGGGYGGPPLSCMMAAVQSSSWADLQPELLGLVLTRLPSLADRVRLRAVCRPWRSNARLQPLPPPLPWLTLLNGTFLSISDGEIHCMPLPDDASCHCSIDNWLFLSHDDGGFSLMNPFSKATLQLPKLDTIWCHHLWYAAPKFPLFYKLAVPAPLDFSPTSLVVALIMNRSHQKALCICQPPVATESFRVEGSTMEGMQDFTFLDGKLYVLNNFNKLFILEIDESHIGNPKISSIECIIDSQDDSTTEPQSFPEDYLIMLRYYLVESGGGLLMVTRYVGIVLPLAEPNSFKHSRTLSFKVFEADLTTGSRMWRRSLPAAECGVPQEDCIYFMCDYWRPYAGEPLCDSGVYNMRNGVITPLLQDATAPRLHPTGRGDPAWFFPADVAT